MRFLLFVVLFLLSFSLVFAYDYCYSSGWAIEGCGSCSSEYGCGVFCNATGNIFPKTIYNVFVSMSANFGYGYNAEATKHFSQYENNQWVTFFSTGCDRSSAVSATNAVNTIDFVSGKKIQLLVSINRCYGSSNVFINGVSISQICFDYYPIQLIVTDGSSPLKDINVTYYYYSGGTWQYIDSKLTDASGSILMDACYNCLFMINITSPNYAPYSQTILVTTNSYIINLARETQGFKTLWDDVVWKIEPEYQYLTQQPTNQTMNLTVLSFNNTLQYFSLNITSLNANQQLFFANNTNPSGGTIYGQYNSTFSNVTLVRIKIKTLNFPEEEIKRVYYSYSVNQTYDYLTIDGLLRFLANQTISVDGMTNENATKLFRGLILSMFLLATTVFVGISMGSPAVFGSSLVSLIILVIFASYGFIEWGIVILVGFISIGLALIFSGVI